MKTSPLSGNGALKLLLLLTSLGHYYSGLVTGAVPAKGICASIAANKSVDFFLVGRNSYNRLLITAKPDYLVYELPKGPLLEDTLDIFDVEPVPLSDYYPGLFTNEHFKSLDAQSAGKVFTFTHGLNDNPNTYLKMLSVDLKLLVTFNMNDKSEVLVSNDFTAPDASQEFVSASDKDLTKAQIYSFYHDVANGSIRKDYDLDINQVMDYSSLELTCKAKGQMVLRPQNKTCGSYQSWNWASSPKGWTVVNDDASSNVRFYLFDTKSQMVSILDEDDNDIGEKDVFSDVHQKTYKDFFVCSLSNVTTTSTPSTTSTEPSTTPSTLPTQPSTTPFVTNVTTRTTATTSSTPVHNATTHHSVRTSSVTKASNRTTTTPGHNGSSSTKTSPDSVKTSSEKPKLALWIIILIVIILVVIIITVVALLSFYCGKESSDKKKPEMAVSTGMKSTVVSSGSNGLGGGDAKRN